MSHPGQSQPTRRHSTGRHPQLPKEQGIDDQRLIDTAPPLRMTVTSQDAENGHKLEKSEHRQEYLQEHVQIWEERHRLGLPQKNLKKPDSASPDDEKKEPEKETSPGALLRASVGPIAGRATTTLA